ncbi:hypothetical protein GCM10010844_14940 [Deinococcus radiotolerans]|uniref:Secreted protein n=1 Tax=Deinococcus radiotolerans TaxID=1309407 RepID=A0ABQ2FHX1_9DEIO|nr:hypothetical protein GCM10010844_14940 [Deinococcus radiotolerans]
MGRLATPLTSGSRKARALLKVGIGTVWALRTAPAGACVTVVSRGAAAAGAAGAGCCPQLLTSRLMDRAMKLRECRLDMVSLL